MDISIAQVKAARSLLDWSQKDLSVHSGIPLQIIQNIDAGRKKSPSQDEWSAITKCIENAGIEFIECDGVRRKQQYIKKFSGVEGFKEFMTLVFEEARDHGGKFRIYNASPSQWKKLADNAWNTMHIQRMVDIFRRGDLDFKITCPQGERNLVGNQYAEYRWLPKEHWSERSFYVFGEYIALLIFHDDTVEIVLFREQALAETFRDLFDIAWDKVAIIPKA